VCALLGIDFGALAMLIGAVTGSRGAAVGLASTFAAAAYLISSLAPVVPWLHPARFASPFVYAVNSPTACPYRMPPSCSPPTPRSERPRRSGTDPPIRKPVRV
jgi:hypothetical protein